MANDGFLEVGSVSWSVLLSIFFMSLHKNGGVNEDSLSDEKLCMNCESCLEMLEVLTNEFGDMIPLETDPNVLEANCPGALVKLRENSFIQVLP